MSIVESSVFKQLSTFCLLQYMKTTIDASQYRMTPVVEIDGHRFITDNTRRFFVNKNDKTDIIVETQDSSTELYCYFKVRGVDDSFSQYDGLLLWPIGNLSADRHSGLYNTNDNITLSTETF